jgi:beta-lactamase class A
MRSLRPVLVLISLFLSLHAQGLGGRPNELSKELDARLGPIAAKFHGTLGIAVRDLKTGEEYLYNGDRRFPSASIIKVPVMVEMLNQVKQGRLHLDDVLTLTDSDKVAGSGVLHFLHTGLQLTLHDALFLMINLSDNSATNMILDALALGDVNAAMERLGLHDTKIFGKVFRHATRTDTALAKEFGLGMTTPADMMNLLAMIYQHKVVDSASSALMMKTMQRQFDGEAIPRFLPKWKEKIIVAHKTGALARNRHDIGIIVSPKAGYVLCILTDENADNRWILDNEALLTIAEISRTVYEVLNR